MKNKRNKLRVFIIIFFILLTAIFLLLKSNHSYMIIKEVIKPNSISSNKLENLNEEINTKEVDGYNNLGLPYEVGDPFIIKENDKYYLYASSENEEKGNVMYYVSTDMNKWERQDSPALKIPTEGIEYFNSPVTGPDGTVYKNTNPYIYAPEVHKYGNKYYMIFTWVKAVYDDNWKRIHSVSEDNIFIACSDSLDEEFTVLGKIDIGGYNAIDPTLFFDEENIYIYYKLEPFSDENGGTSLDSKCIYVAKLTNGFNTIENMNPNDNTSVITDRIIETIERNKVISFNGNSPDFEWESNCVEGPCILKKNNKYYLMYCTGFVNDETYKVGYAISNSPTGPFEKNSESILQGDDPLTKAQNSNGTIIKTWDRTNYLYGTGHNSILKISDDEIYCVYHSAVFKYNDSLENKYWTRKLNVDYLDVDNDGKLFVSGPTAYCQPLPSGTNDLYRVKKDDYKIYINNDYSNENNILKDNKTFVNSKYEAVNAEDVKTLEINSINNVEYLSDIWFYGNIDGEDFLNKIINIEINGKYVINNINLGDSNHLLKNVGVYKRIESNKNENGEVIDKGTIDIVYKENEDEYKDIINQFENEYWITKKKDISKNIVSKIKIPKIPETIQNIKIETVGDNNYLNLSEIYLINDKGKYNGLPIVDVTYSKTELTKEDILVTITSNKEVKDIDGWNLSKDKKVLTKTYKENIEETVEIEDLVGNKTNAKVKIENIDKIESDIYEISNENYTIDNIVPDTTKEILMKNIVMNQNCKLLTKDGTEIIEEDSVIATGNIIKTGMGNEYELIVKGDVNGDGIISIKDMIIINNYRLFNTTNKFSGIYQKAGDVNNDNKKDIRDMIIINNYRLFRTPIIN